MDYKDWSSNDFISRIGELEMVIEEIKKEKDQYELLNFAWTNNLGHWYWVIPANHVHFNPLKVTSLGYTEAEIPETVDFQFFTSKLHPDDFGRVMKVMEDHLSGKLPAYEVEYRIQTKEGGWKWYYDRGKITQYDENGSPKLVSGIVFDITNTKRLQEELLEKNQQLEMMMKIDGLTGLYNHNAIMAALDEAMQKARNTGEELMAFLFDIDDFKRINDHFGHIAGDHILAGIAKFILTQLRDNDVAGRYGGEEFLIIFPKTSEDKGIQLAEYLRQNIESQRFDGRISVTISGGIANFMGQSVEAIIKEADDYLYQAKNNGKNKVFGSNGYR